MSAVVRPLEGRVRVVSDKSLTHRGVLLGACAEGRTVLARPNFGADCRATLRAVERLGVGVEIEEDAWVLDGGKSRLHEPPDVLDLENSGTGMRLLAGVASGVAGLSVLTGDASLRRRPMRRITDPLEAMGARISCRTGGQAPLAITGGALHAIDWKSEAASAQVKSAVLLAGLWVNSGTIRFEEPASSRDHTERLLAYLGAAVEHRPRFVALHGGASLRARSWSVPADPSAAAFFAVAATLVSGSALELTDVALNPTR
ncbi:MAG: 3-phosphoshikimate 1-carboxyvinyltransferase, partial [Candidatus Eisenbacteria bacterium]|nr:3-phosphoshikimate 1-carboxyvinyltransferase [Candidatus Eisenbacteria bacterium]